MYPFTSKDKLPSSNSTASNVERYPVGTEWKLTSSSLYTAEEVFMTTSSLPGIVAVPITGSNFSWCVRRAKATEIPILAAIKKNTTPMRTKQAVHMCLFCSRVWESAATAFFFIQIPDAVSDNPSYTWSHIECRHSFTRVTSWFCFLGRWHDCTR